MTAFLEVVYRISGKGNYTVFQLLNVLFLCVSFFSMYKITDIFFKKDKVNNILLILLFGCHGDHVFNGFYQKKKAQTAGVICDSGFHDIYVGCMAEYILWEVLRHWNQWGCSKNLMGGNGASGREPGSGVV